jgi:HSP20 family protein
MVVRLHPWTGRLFDEMDRLFAETLEGGRVAPQQHSFRPAIDMYDTGEGFVVRAVVPGATPETLDVSMEQSTLHISGRWGYTLSEDEMKRATWYRREIGSGQFAQSIQLPAPVDSEHVTANFEHGILTLWLPKAEQARTKRIEISSPKALTS